MPTYAYRCRKCEHAFEEFHGIRDEKPRKCPRCGARAARVPGGGAGLLFKGTGFYITDYRSKSYTDSAKKEAGGGAGDSGGKSGSKSGGEGKKAGGEGGKSGGEGGKSGGDGKKAGGH